MLIVDHKYPTPLTIVSIILMGFLGGPVFSLAQEVALRPVSDCYAITDAHIVQSPERVIENGTIVIREGIISKVGRNVSIPDDALVLEGDSLWVYAGFIDGISRIGVQTSANKHSAKVIDPSNPPPEVAGLTPEQDVRDALNPEHQQIEEFRKAGFTTAHVVPFGIFLPGQGTLIMLGGESATELVLKANFSLYAELSWNNAVYPSTLIGVIAQFKELYRQAELLKYHQSAYVTVGEVMRRPESNRVLESFYPVIEGKKPVFFKAEKALDVYRVLEMRKELNFSSLLMGPLKDSWVVVDRLKDSGLGIFMSLKLPDKSIEEEDSIKTKTKTAEQKNLTGRRKEFYSKYLSSAATLEKAGIPFGFSTWEISGKEVHENVMRMIKAGLTKEAALAALTTTPARLLNVSHQLGTVDPGKIANLVIVDRSYFEDAAKIQFVFVDGKYYEAHSNESEKLLLTKGENRLTGQWSIVAQTPQGEINLSMKINREGNGYSGTLSGGELLKTTVLDNIQWDGTTLSFKYKVILEDVNTVEVMVEGEIINNILKGNMKVGEYGTYLLEGTKDP